MKTFLWVCYIGLSLATIAWSIRFDQRREAAALVQKQVWHSADVFCGLSQKGYHVAKVQYNGKTVYATCTGKSDPLNPTFGVTFSQKEAE